MSENQKQREYWSGVVGQNWVARQDTFDKGFTHITAALMEFAAPAASVPPMSVQKASHAKCAGSRPTTVLQARIMAGSVVTSSSSMMRGLVSAM